MEKSKEDVPHTASTPSLVLSLFVRKLWSNPWLVDCGMVLPLHRHLSAKTSSSGGKRSQFSTEHKYIKWDAQFACLKTTQICKGERASTDHVLMVHGMHGVVKAWHESITALTATHSYMLLETIRWRLFSGFSHGAVVETAWNDIPVSFLKRISGAEQNLRKPICEYVVIPVTTLWALRNDNHSKIDSARASDERIKPKDPPDTNLNSSVEPMTPTARDWKVALLRDAGASTLVQAAFLRSQFLSTTESRPTDQRPLLLGDELIMVSDAEIHDQLHRCDSAVRRRVTYILRWLHSLTLIPLFYVLHHKRAFAKPDFEQGALAINHSFDCSDIRAQLFLGVVDPTAQEPCVCTGVYAHLVIYLRDMLTFAATGKGRLPYVAAAPYLPVPDNVTEQATSSSVMSDTSDVGERYAAAIRSESPPPQKPVRVKRRASIATSRAHGKQRAAMEDVFARLERSNANERKDGGGSSKRDLEERRKLLLKRRASVALKLKTAEKTEPEENPPIAVDAASSSDGSRMLYLQTQRARQLSTSVSSDPRIGNSQIRPSLRRALRDDTPPPSDIHSRQDSPSHRLSNITDSAKDQQEREPEAAHRMKTKSTGWTSMCGCCCAHDPRDTRYTYGDAGRAPKKTPEVSPLPHSETQQRAHRLRGRASIPGSHQPQPHMVNGSGRPYEYSHARVASMSHTAKPYTLGIGNHSPRHPSLSSAAAPSFSQAHYGHNPGRSGMRLAPPSKSHAMMTMADEVSIRDLESRSFEASGMSVSPYASYDQDPSVAQLRTDMPSGRSGLHEHASPSMTPGWSVMTLQAGAPGNELLPPPLAGASLHTQHGTDGRSIYGEQRGSPRQQRSAFVMSSAKQQQQLSVLPPPPPLPPSESKRNDDYDKLTSTVMISDVNAAMQSMNFVSKHMPELYSGALFEDAEADKTTAIFTQYLSWVEGVNRTVDDVINCVVECCAENRVDSPSGDPISTRLSPRRMYGFVESLLYLSNLILNFEKGRSDRWLSGSISALELLGLLRPLVSPFADPTYNTLQNASLGEVAWSWQALWSPLPRIDAKNTPLFVQFVNSEQASSSRGNAVSVLGAALKLVCESLNLRGVLNPLQTALVRSLETDEDVFPTDADNEGRPASPSSAAGSAATDIVAVLVQRLSAVRTWPEIPSPMSSKMYSVESRASYSYKQDSTLNGALLSVGRRPAKDYIDFIRQTQVYLHTHCETALGDTDMQWVSGTFRSLCVGGSVWISAQDAHEKLERSWQNRSLRVKAPEMAALSATSEDVLKQREGQNAGGVRSNGNEDDNARLPVSGDSEEYGGASESWDGSQFSVGDRAMEQLGEPFSPKADRVRGHVYGILQDIRSNQYEKLDGRKYLPKHGETVRNKRDDAVRQYLRHKRSCKEQSTSGVASEYASAHGSAPRDTGIRIDTVAAESAADNMQGKGLTVTVTPSPLATYAKLVAKPQVKDPSGLRLSPQHAKSKKVRQFWDKSDSRSGVNVRNLGKTKRSMSFGNVLSVYMTADGKIRDRRRHSALHGLQNMTAMPSGDAQGDTGHSRSSATRGKSDYSDSHAEDVSVTGVRSLDPRAHVRHDSAWRQQTHIPRKKAGSSVQAISIPVGAQDREGVQRQSVGDVRSSGSPARGGAYLDVDLHSNSQSSSSMMIRPVSHQEDTRRDAGRKTDDASRHALPGLLGPRDTGSTQYASHSARKRRSDWPPPPPPSPPLNKDPGMFPFEAGNSSESKELDRGLLRFDGALLKLFDTVQAALRKSRTVCSLAVIRALTLLVMSVARRHNTAFACDDAAANCKEEGVMGYPMSWHALWLANVTSCRNLYAKTIGGYSETPSLMLHALSLFGSMLSNGSKVLLDPLDPIGSLPSDMQQRFAMRAGFASGLWPGVRHRLDVLSASDHCEAYYRNAIDTLVPICALSSIILDDLNDYFSYHPTLVGRVISNNTGYDLAASWGVCAPHCRELYTLVKSTPLALKDPTKSARKSAQTKERRFMPAKPASVLARIRKELVPRERAPTEKRMGFLHTPPAPPPSPPQHSFGQRGTESPLAKPSRGWSMQPLSRNQRIPKLKLPKQLSRMSSRVQPALRHSRRQAMLDSIRYGIPSATGSVSSLDMTLVGRSDNISSIVPPLHLSMLPVTGGIGGGERFEGCCPGNVTGGCQKSLDLLESLGRNMGRMLVDEVGVAIFRSLSFKADAANKFKFSMRLLPHKRDHTSLPWFELNEATAPYKTLGRTGLTGKTDPSTMITAILTAVKVRLALLGSLSYVIADRAFAAGDEEDMSGARALAERALSAIVGRLRLISFVLPGPALKEVCLIGKTELAIVNSAKHSISMYACNVLRLLRSRCTDTSSLKRIGRLVRAQSWMHTTAFASVGLNREGYCLPTMTQPVFLIRTVRACLGVSSACRMLGLRVKENAGLAQLRDIIQWLCAFITRVSPTLQWRLKCLVSDKTKRKLVDYMSTILFVFNCHIDAFELLLGLGNFLTKIVLRQREFLKEVSVQRGEEKQESEANAASMLPKAMVMLLTEYCFTFSLYAHTAVCGVARFDMGIKAQWESERPDMRKVVETTFGRINQDPMLSSGLFALHESARGENDALRQRSLFSLTGELIPLLISVIRGKAQKFGQTLLTSCCGYTLSAVTRVTARYLCVKNSLITSLAADSWAPYLLAHGQPTIGVDVMCQALAGAYTGHSKLISHARSHVVEHWITHVLAHRTKPSLGVPAGQIHRYFAQIRPLLLQQLLILCSPLCGNDVASVTQRGTFTRCSHSSCIMAANHSRERYEVYTASLPNEEAAEVHPDGILCWSRCMRTKHPVSISAPFVGVREEVAHRRSQSAQNLQHPPTVPSRRSARTPVHTGKAKRSGVWWLAPDSIGIIPVLMVNLSDFMLGQKTLDVPVGGRLVVNEITVNRPSPQALIGQAKVMLHAWQALLGALAACFRPVLVRQAPLWRIPNLIPKGALEGDHITMRGIRLFHSGLLANNYVYAASYTRLLCQIWSETMARCKVIVGCFCRQNGALPANSPPKAAGADGPGKQSCRVLNTFLVVAGMHTAAARMLYHMCALGHSWEAMVSDEKTGTVHTTCWDARSPVQIKSAYHVITCQMLLSKFFHAISSEVDAYNRYVRSKLTHPAIREALDKWNTKLVPRSEMKQANNSQIEIDGDGSWEYPESDLDSADEGQASKTGFRSTPLSRGISLALPSCSRSSTPAQGMHRLSGHEVSAEFKSQSDAHMAPISVDGSIRRGARSRCEVDRAPRSGGAAGAEDRGHATREPGSKLTAEQEEKGWFAVDDVDSDEEEQKSEVTPPPLPEQLTKKGWFAVEEEDPAPLPEKLTEKGWFVVEEEEGTEEADRQTAAPRPRLDAELRDKGWFEVDDSDLEVPAAPPSPPLPNDVHGTKSPEELKMQEAIRTAFLTPPEHLPGISKSVPTGHYFELSKESHAADLCLLLMLCLAEEGMSLNPLYVPRSSIEDVFKEATEDMRKSSTVCDLENNFSIIGSLTIRSYHAAHDHPVSFVALNENRDVVADLYFNGGMCSEDTHAYRMTRFDYDMSEFWLRNFRSYKYGCNALCVDGKDGAERMNRWRMPPIDGEHSRRPRSSGAPLGWPVRRLSSVPSSRRPSACWSEDLDSEGASVQITEAVPTPPPPPRPPSSTPPLLTPPLMLRTLGTASGTETLSDISSASDVRGTSDNADQALLSPSCREWDPVSSAVGDDFLEGNLVFDVGMEDHLASSSSEGDLFEISENEATDSDLVADGNEGTQKPPVAGAGQEQSQSPQEGTSQADNLAYAAPINAMDFWNELAFIAYHGEVIGRFQEFIHDHFMLMDCSRTLMTFAGLEEQTPPVRSNRATDDPVAAQVAATVESDVEVIRLMNQIWTSHTVSLGGWTRVNRGFARFMRLLVPTWRRSPQHLDSNALALRDYKFLPERMGRGAYATVYQAEMLHPESKDTVSVVAKVVDRNSVQDHCALRDVYTEVSVMEENMVKLLSLPQKSRPAGNENDLRVPLRSISSLQGAYRVTDVEKSLICPLIDFGIRVTWQGDRQPREDPLSDIVSSISLVTNERIGAGPRPDSPAPAGYVPVPRVPLPHGSLDFVMILPRYRTTLRQWRVSRPTPVDDMSFGSDDEELDTSESEDSEILRTRELPPTKQQDMTAFPKDPRILSELRTYLRLYFKVLLAVWRLHTLGILHLDLKCDNVLLNTGCFVSTASLVADWKRKRGTRTTNQDSVDEESGDILHGILCPFRLVRTSLTPTFRASNEDDPAVALADFGESVYGETNLFSISRGTENVQSPEMQLLQQALDPSHPSHDRRQKSCLDAQSDVWSLGCLLYELLTGRWLFEEVIGLPIFSRVTEKSAPLFRRAQLARLRRISTPCVEQFLRWMLVRDRVRRPSLMAVIDRFVEVFGELL